MPNSHHSTKINLEPIPAYAVMLERNGLKGVFINGSSGEVLFPLKGGKWKGCFHVPRGLFQCYRMLEDLANTTK